MSSRASRTSRGLSGSTWRDDAGPSVRAVVERTTFVKLNEVAPTRLRTVFRNVDPATAKQIADECGGNLRVALAVVDLLQMEPPLLRVCR